MNPDSTPLQQLRAIHLPPDAGWWPPAPGWWVLAGLILIAAGIVARLLYRRIQSSRRNRRVLELLTDIRQRFAANANPTGLVTEVSMLLRRVALLTHARREVAGLTGIAWLQFLDQSGGQGQFCNGAGRALADGPYTPSTQVNSEDLLNLAARWIHHNLGGLK